MLKRKLPKNAVIRAQKEIIRAQDVLIEWLLQLVQKGQKQFVQNPQTPSEARNGDD
jgi:hypothetical protein